MVAALKEPVEDSDEENEDNMETDGDGPLWKLFDQLYNATNSSGTKKKLVLIHVTNLGIQKKNWLSRGACIFYLNFDFMMS